MGASYADNLPTVRCLEKNKKIKNKIQHTKTKAAHTHTHTHTHTLSLSLSLSLQVPPFYVSLPPHPHPHSPSLFMLTILMVMTNHPWSASFSSSSNRLHQKALGDCIVLPCPDAQSLLRQIYSLCPQTIHCPRSIPMSCLSQSNAGDAIEMTLDVKIAFCHTFIRPY